MSRCASRALVCACDNLSVRVIACRCAPASCRKTPSSSNVAPAGVRKHCFGLTGCFLLLLQPVQTESFRSKIQTVTAWHAVSASWPTQTCNRPRFLAKTAKGERSIHSFLRSLCQEVRSPGKCNLSVSSSRKNLIQRRIVHSTICKCCLSQPVSCFHTVITQ